MLILSSPAPRQPAAPAQSLAAEIQQLKNLLAEPGVRRASHPALQRQGSVVEEVDMVDCQLEEEEEEEMMLRRRCLSLTQLETRSFSSLPSSPLGTPLKNRLLGTPSKSSPKGTPKKMAATPVRRPILTPVRSNPTLLTPVRNQKQEEPDLSSTAWKQSSLWMLQDLIASPQLLGNKLLFEIQSLNAPGPGAAMLLFAEMIRHYNVY